MQPPFGPPSPAGYNLTPQPPFLDVLTIHWMVAATFLIQAILIYLLSRTVRRYPGIRMFFYATLLLAAGSLVVMLGPWLAERFLGTAANLVLFWGTALQYVAVARFVGRPTSKLLLFGVVGGGSLVLAWLGQENLSVPFGPFEEALTALLFFGVARVILKADLTGFRLGAMLTVLPFVGYAVLSVARVVRGVFDPTQMQPGAHLSDDIDAVLLYVFGFLWTSGFLFMVNQRLQSELTNLATHDPLTGCLNRRAMDRRLTDEHDSLTRYGRPYSVLLFDLDRFKAINDTQGHPVGDQVLVEYAALVRRSLRAGDALARWGGEEFLVLLPETGLGEAAALAERIRVAVEAQPFSDRRVSLTVSTGVAAARADEPAHHVCHRADGVLYQAKGTRNRVVVDESTG